jgi:hypothetical protein
MVLMRVHCQDTNNLPLMGMVTQDTNLLGRMPMNKLDLLQANILLQNLGFLTGL